MPVNFLRGFIRFAFKLLLFGLCHPMFDTVLRCLRLAIFLREGFTGFAKFDDIVGHIGLANLPRFNHELRLHHAVKFGLGHKAQRDGFFAKRCAVFMRGLGDLRRIVIANGWCQCGDEHE